MIQIRGRNVEEAWAIFKRFMSTPQWVTSHTRIVAPRGRTTVEVNEPVATVYSAPAECVLLDPYRDANPFFHLYEALWILGGFRDVRRVAYYAKQMLQYSDDGEELNGAYGFRMRSRFGFDQIENVIQVLRSDPDSRRAVIALYAPGDALTSTKDLPCNTTIFFKLRDGKLTMTVANRSNDAVWGCYGANAVHFSILQQYIAGALGVEVGAYTQVSDSLHVYVDDESAKVWERCMAAGSALYHDYSYSAIGLTRTPLLVNQSAFDLEVSMLLEDPSGRAAVGINFTEPFLREVACPLFAAYETYKAGDVRGAVQKLTGSRDAWLVAGCDWLIRREVSK